MQVGSQVVACMFTFCLVRVSSKPIQLQSVKHGRVCGPTGGPLYTRTDSSSFTPCVPLLVLSIYSKTSNNGPSEKQTTSLQRMAHLPQIDFSIELIDFEPPRSGVDQLNVLMRLMQAMRKIVMDNKNDCDDFHSTYTS